MSKGNQGQEDDPSQHDIPRPTEQAFIDFRRSDPNERPTESNVREQMEDLVDSMTEDQKVEYFGYDKPRNSIQTQQDLDIVGEYEKREARTQVTEDLEMSNNPEALTQEYSDTRESEYTDVRSDRQPNVWISPFVQYSLLIPWLKDFLQKNQDTPWNSEDEEANDSWEWTVEEARRLYQKLT